MKTFNVVGVSTLNGIVKVRYAKDMKREKVLARNGHTDIHLFELPNAMTEAEALQWFNDNHSDRVSNITVRAAKEPKADPVVTDTVEDDSEGEFTLKQVMTLEEAIAIMPKRNKGRFLSKAEREQMAKDYLNSN